MLHLCDFLCVDGLVCGRPHSHLQHNAIMRKVRMARVLGGQAAVDMVEKNPELYIGHIETTGDDYSVVTANHNIWQASTNGRAYSALLAASTSSLLAKDEHGQKYTRYSADHGGSWSKKYYDRSSSDSSSGSQTGDSQDLDGSGILSGVDSPISSSDARSASTPGNQLSSSLSSGASDIARHISFNESVEVQPIPPEGAGNSVAEHLARSAEKRAEKKRSRSNSGEPPSPSRRRLDTDELDVSADNLVGPLDEMEIAVSPQLVPPFPDIPDRPQVVFARFQDDTADQEQVNEKFVCSLANIFAFSFCTRTLPARRAPQLTTAPWRRPPALLVAQPLLLMSPSPRQLTTAMFPPAPSWSLLQGSIPGKSTPFLMTSWRSLWTF